MAIERLGEGTLSEKQGLIDDMMGDLKGPGRLLYADYIAYNENDDQKAGFFRCEGLFAIINEKLPTITPDILDHLARHNQDNPAWLQNFFAKIHLPEDFNPQELLRMFRSLELGTLKTLKDFRQALKNKGMKVSRWADGLLATDEFKKSISKQKHTQQTVTIPVKYLFADGAPEGATRQEIYDQAENELDLTQATAEAALYARIADTDQLEGGNYVPAIKPIDSDGDQWVFSVTHDSAGLWLHANTGNVENWSPNDSGLFFRGKAPSQT